MISNTTHSALSDLESRLSSARQTLRQTTVTTCLMTIAVYGLAWVAIVGLVDLLLPIPILIRGLLVIGLVGLVVWSAWNRLVLPLRQRITVQDLALIVGHKHPELEDRLVSAVQVGQDEAKDPVQQKIWARLMQDAASATTEINFKAAIDKQPLNKVVWITMGLLLVGSLIRHNFPTQTEIALRRLFMPWGRLLPVRATRYTVTPGNARILRGASLKISVQTTGKKADQVVATFLSATESTVKPASGKKEVSLHQTGDRTFAYERFNLQSDLNYYLLANQTRAEVFSIKVFDPPALETIELSYDYPAYTGFKPTVQHRDGNLRAIVGTEATIRLTTNKGISSATVRFGDGEPVPLAISAGNVLTFKHTLKHRGGNEKKTYQIDLKCVDGFANQAPIVYQIQAIPDRKPTVVIKEPERDLRVTKLAEIQIEAAIIDDFGLLSTDFKYQLSDRDQQELEPETEQEMSVRSRQSRYTLYLEAQDLEVGDVISYFVEATDTASQRARSEIYFIEIKPFNERYREMESLPGQADSPAVQALSQLAQEQKQIIRQTWQYLSSLPDLDLDAVKQTTTAQRDLQKKTQKAVNEISGMMTTMSVDPEMLILLEKAVEQMTDAADKLDQRQLDSAIVTEQAVLENLIKATAKLEKILTKMQPGQNQQAAEDLDLKMDQLQSQFEQDQQEADLQQREQVKEMLDQVRQNRQQQQVLTEESQQLAQSGQNPPGPIRRNSQRQQRLSQQSQMLADQGANFSNSAGTAGQQLNRDLQKTAELQQQAAQALDQKQPQKASAFGKRADGKLSAVERQLEQMLSQQTQQALQETTEQLDQLGQQQSKLQQQTDRLAGKTEELERENQDTRNQHWQEATELSKRQKDLQRELQQVERNLANLQQALEREGKTGAARSVAETSRQMGQDQVEERMYEAQRSLRWHNLDNALKNQDRALNAMRKAADHRSRAEGQLVLTESEQLENMLERLDRWEDQLQDVQRAGQTGQASGLAEQMDQARQQSMSAYSSSTEYEKLWLDALEGLYRRRAGRPAPDFKLALSNIQRLKQTLEARLTEMKEKQQLSRLSQAKVPPEYKSAVHQYYEEIAQ